MNALFNKKVRPNGRPSKYSESLVCLICSELAEGKSLKEVCLQKRMPSKATVYRWLRDMPGFRDQYARAREESSDALFEDLLEIADDARDDWIEVLDQNDKRIGWHVDGEQIQRSKLRVEARKWMMSKMKPKKYGKRINLEVIHSGLSLTDKLNAAQERGVLLHVNVREVAV